MAITRARIQEIQKGFRRFLLDHEKEMQKQPENREIVRGGSGTEPSFMKKEEGMYARESFTIAEVADLCQSEDWSDSYQDNFRWNVPLRGFKRKMQFCIRKMEN